MTISKNTSYFLTAIKYKIPRDKCDEKHAIFMKRKLLNTIERQRKRYELENSVLSLNRKSLSSKRIILPKLIYKLDTLSRNTIRKLIVKFIWKNK